MGDKTSFFVLCSPLFIRISRCPKKINIEFKITNHLIESPELNFQKVFKLIGKRKIAPHKKNPFSAHQAETKSRKQEKSE